MNALSIINKYYPEENELKHILLMHSKQVCAKALQVHSAHPELHLDATILENGAILHDIGIFLTHAPSICCYGNADYLMHGYLGGELLRREGLEIYSRICERHTGTGITKELILERGLDIPVQDYLPETMEEIVICYADKFYSKSHLDKEKKPEQVYKSLLKFGEDGAKKFMSWHMRFQ